MRNVLVLNASNEVLAFVDWQRAVTLVALDSAHVVEEQEGHQIRSQHLTIPLPQVIRLNAYVHVRWHAGMEVSSPTRANILARDLSTCIYCRQLADTIDHILPQSRGGLNTWDNLAAACFSCNNRKGDRTPAEAGMKLLWEPYDFSRSKRQRRRLRDLGIVRPIERQDSDQTRKQPRKEAS